KGKSMILTFLVQRQGAGGSSALTNKSQQQQQQQQVDFGHEIIEGDNRKHDINAKLIKGNNYGNRCKIGHLTGDNHGERCMIYKVSGNNFGSYCQIYDLAGVCKGKLNILGIKEKESSIKGFKNILDPDNPALKELEAVGYQSMIALDNNDDLSKKTLSQETPSQTPRLDCPYSYQRNLKCLVCCANDANCVVVCSAVTAHYGICYACANVNGDKCFVCRTPGIRLYKRVED